VNKECYCDDRHKYSHKFGTLKVKNQEIENFHFWAIRALQKIVFKIKFCNPDISTN